MSPSPNPWRIALKALLLFGLLNLLLTLTGTEAAGRLSLYNGVIPGRLRFPFGENPRQAYNISLFNLDAMFASHVVSAQPAGDSLRVFLVGDSSVWGTLLRPEETLSGVLNAADLTACGRPVEVFNLGYPTISLTKDLMILDQARAHAPGMVIWLTTLQAFPAAVQTASPIVANNAARVDDLGRRYGLALPGSPVSRPAAALLAASPFGQRRNLADIFRLQLYGVLWAATGVDQFYPDAYTPAQVDFDADDTFQDLAPPDLEAARLAWDVLAAGMTAAGDVPLVLVNEPILVSSGRNSDIRYNFFYPRWAYDQYRQLLAQHAGRAGWRYHDLWDIVPAAEFTNSAIHLTPAGERLLAARVATIIQAECRP